MSVDLTSEPVSISVFEHTEAGRVGFSDLPEQVIPALVESFGAEAVARALTPTEVELSFFTSLEPSARSQPGFVELLDNGELERRVAALEKQGAIAKRVPFFMTAINRSDEAIFGRTGGLYLVCRKGCHFCQYRGFDEREATAEELAERMLALQEAGADNIQWISPTAHTRVLLKALLLAGQQGLRLPIVHKGEGEDSLADLGLLNGAVDCYLPDIKFITPEFADTIGLRRGYPKRMRACIAEMYRQVGPLRRRSGEALALGGGVLVRHLIMPGGVSEANAIFEFLKTIDIGFPVHVMATYEPLHDAADHPGINRHVTAEEVRAVAEAAHELELSRVYVR